MARVIGVDFIVMGLLFGYWEWRYRKFGWGRGWMKAVPRGEINFPQSYPDVWDDRWSFDLDLPSK